VTRGKSLVSWVVAACVCLAAAPGHAINRPDDATDRNGARDVAQLVQAPPGSASSEPGAARGSAPAQPSGSAASPSSPVPTTSGGPPAPVADRAEMDAFLDRLMMAESGGRDGARNPKSTAVGAYQFIVETFLDVARRHFAAETAALSPTQILALRTDRAFARRAAEAFTRDNAAHLVANGQPATWAHLRLAFLVGPAGAVRVLQAPPETALGALLGAAAMQANPFMTRLTAAELVSRAAREVDASTDIAAGPAVEPQARRVAAKARAPQIVVSCDLTLPACRKWLSLAERRLRTGTGTRVATR
jgi:hypothetical protein